MMNANYIEFFFDCSSPWTYLSFNALKDLAEHHNVELIYKPILVGGIFNSVNPSVYENRSKPLPIKEKYYLNDMQNWASCREIYSIFQANKLNCDIITVPYSLLSKLKLIGKNLNKYSVETSRDFFKDSKDITFNF